MKKVNLSYVELSSLKEDLLLEVLQYKHYKDDVLFDCHKNGMEFKNCLFEGISFDNVNLENCYFMDVVFKDCDLSNIQLLSCLFRRVEISNCKLLGTDFSESLFDNVVLKDSQCGFANFAFMKNKACLFDNCDLHNASILETQLQKTIFKECLFRQCEIQHSSLFKVDLSTCDLNDIITTPQDIQGAIINEYQATSLIHLLRVHIKEENLE